jgi:hypothetical protein
MSDSQDRLFQGFLGYGGFSALDVDATGLIRRALNRPAQPAKPPSGARSQPAGLRYSARMFTSGRGLTAVSELLSEARPVA